MEKLKVGNEVEKKIITGMIVNDRFCREMIIVGKRQYFNIPYCRTIYNWIEKYYNKYKQAPGKHIKDIYDQKVNKLSSAEAEIVSQFLSDLSDKYEEEENFNIDFCIDHGLRYFRKQALLVNAEEVRRLVEADRLEEADAVHSAFKSVAKELSPWVNPFDVNYIKGVCEAEEKGEDRVVRFNGDLGKLLGWLMRDWFMLFVSPVKGGKTWFMQEVSILTLLNRKKVALFELEMGDRRMSKRIYQRILGASWKRKRTYLWPVFDCEKNQIGTCNKKERRNEIILRKEGGLHPRFEDVSKKYKPCTYCKDNDIKGYKVDSWLEERRLKRIEYEAICKKAEALKIMYGDNFRIMARPTYSAGIKTVKRDLDYLYYSEGFAPDLIVIDYPSIMKKEGVDSSSFDSSDQIFGELKGLAGERNCLLVGGEQVPKKVWEKKMLKKGDTFGDSRKLGHIDIGTSLNQTDDERRRGVLRFGILAVRDDGFAESDHCYILQSLDTGQVVVDSCFM